MKTVLILGAGVYQLPLIHAAKAIGCRVCVASYRSTDPGMALADEAWVIDTTDIEGITRRAVAAKIDAAATFDASDLRARIPRFEPDALTHNVALVATLQRIAARKGATPAQIALAR